MAIGIILKADDETAHHGPSLLLTLTFSPNGDPALGRPLRFLFAVYSYTDSKCNAST